MYRHMNCVLGERRYKKVTWRQITRTALLAGRRGIQRGHKVARPKTGLGRLFQPDELASIHLMLPFQTWNAVKKQCFYFTCFWSLLKQILTNQTVFVYVLLNLKDKKAKEQETKEEPLHPLLKKSEKNSPTYKEPPTCLLTQIQTTKALLNDHKATQGGAPEKGKWSHLSSSWCDLDLLCKLQIREN